MEGKIKNIAIGKKMMIKKMSKKARMKVKRKMMISNQM